VVLAVSRATGRGREAALEIRRATGNERVHFLPADLARPGDVRAMAIAASRHVEHLDALVANAGVVAFQRHETPEGYERTFALNHLGTFLSTMVLLPLLRRSAASRVVVVSSNAARFGRLQLDDPHSRRRYDGWRAYAWTKLANQLFAFELARRMAGTSVSVNAVHPGFVATGFGHDGTTMGRLVALSQRLFGRSAARGADSLVWLAASADAAALHGAYVVDRREREPAPLARDEEAQARLWQLSEAMVGLEPGEAAGAAPDVAQSEGGPPSAPRHTTQRA
jgi:NAD(P)-dependent dehydrogenase (short-subunit alcohol dehydrogenase family)